MDFNSLLQQSSAHAWLYLPVAVLLGGLHGLEPGHSKTMMAAFIVAVRGTVTQAVLLGLSAAISHSLIIWALAAMALRFGNQWRVETAEPYFLIGTGLIVVAMALWTLWRLRRGRGHHHHHHHDEHDHGHAEEERTLDFAGGTAVLSIFEDGVPPRFRVVSASESLTPLRVKTIRPNGNEQSFTLVRAGGFWESAEEIPEPHAFEVKLTVAGTEGEQTLATHFTEHDHHHDHHHDHDHHHHHQGHDDEEDDDEHTRQHAEQIRRRFDGREVTTTQIVLFGLTGGLMPCPAALSILLVCLQVKKFTLGFSMVAAFSLGLALTLVAVGVTAAWGIRKVSHGNGFLSRLAHRAPQISSWVLIALGSVFMLRGFWQLP